MTQNQASLEGIPDRPLNARTGSQFFQDAKDLGLAEREQLLFDEVLSGNVPDFLRQLCEVSVTAPKLPAAAIRVTRDYLAVGSNEDFLRMPMTPISAQRIADACGCILPTKKLVDDIYAASRQQVAIPLQPSPAMVTLTQFKLHNDKIQAALQGQVGELLAGHKKDLVVTKRLLQSARRLAIYGFFKLDGTPFQELNTQLTTKLPHEDTYADYSHGVRLVSKRLLVNGEERDIDDVLRDPVLCALLSGEGALTAPRYKIFSLGSAGPVPRSAVPSR